MKNIAILGSTGSIGRSTLSVVRSQAKHFRAACLSVNSDIDNLYKQIKEFRPFSVCVRDKKSAAILAKKIKPSIKIYCGESGLEELVKDKRIDQVMFALSGAAALRPLVSAIKSVKDIALANKEAMVMAGPIIMRLAARHKVKILPVDSEQSAIWQALSGSSSTSISSIYLTASGGPFRSVPKNKLRSVTINDVLAHPRWRMGRKITVDSATLMNKGLELLEAMFLFNVEAEKIKVLIHPEAIIHSMVEFADGVVIAQLSEPDMRIPIQYALSYPARLPGSLPKINFYGLKNLNFGKPDFDKFPSLGLAYQAARDLGSMPAVLNAANEESVESFLNKRISFLDIPRVVARVMARHRRVSSPDLRQVMQTDSWAREEARSIISSLKS
ncbi:MAG: 1-deoxy-D-xylulose-5-phosphate reductoisomerase [Candidatus Omnitrophica bacterium]|nr:1-deoxy-D-xylulose-5-phosphate reductoisomerase [Candidatus Omnitrophota bacterium]